MSAIIRKRRPSAHIGNSEDRVDGLDAPPDKGGSIRRGLPDTFELGRMAKYVQHYANDPIVVRTARNIARVCKAKDKMCEMGAVFLWCKSRFRYVSDPVNREVIQTPVSQISEILTPPQVIEAILGPKLVGQMQGFGHGDSLFTAGHQIVSGCCFKSELSGPKPETSGDFDEGATLLATLLAAIGIPSRFRLGGTSSGDACNYHHVWAQGKNELGDWVDMDITEDRSKLGWFYEGFDCFGHVNIPGISDGS